jgi:DNA-binding GntR family transcriptional regulator
MAEHEALIRIISSRDEPAFAPALRAHLDRTHRR